MKQLFLLLAFLSCMFSVKADDLTALVTNSQTGLDNGTIDLDVTAGVAPYTFSWTGPNGFSSSDEDIINLAPGEYCVTVTDQYCGIAALCVLVEEEVATGMQADQNMPSLEVFPNPFSGDFNVELNLPTEGSYTFYLTDAGGKVVFSQYKKLGSGKNTLHFDLKEVLPSGSYELMMRGEGNAVLSRRIVQIR